MGAAPGAEEGPVTRGAGLLFGGESSPGGAGPSTKMIFVAKEAGRGFGVGARGPYNAASAEVWPDEDVAVA
jgi:hypothetical protein